MIPTQAILPCNPIEIIKQIIKNATSYPQGVDCQAANAYHEMAKGAGLMKLKWLDSDDRRGNCYAGVNFRDVRIITFSIQAKLNTYYDRTGKPGWIMLVGKEPIGTYANKGQAQQAAQRFLDDFIRGLFASDDYE